MASEREIAFARYWEGKEGRKLTVDVVRDAYLAGWSDKPAPQTHVAVTDLDIQTAYEAWLDRTIGARAPITAFNAGYRAALDRTNAPAPSQHVVLAPKHTGLRVDYTGLLKSARQGLQREPGTAEMLNQLEEHLSELGRRWYDGDATVVDEFLQLYCIQRVRRDVLTAGTTEGQDNG